MKHVFFLFVLFLAPGLIQAACEAPIQSDFTVVSEIKRSRTGFTQGLIYLHGKLIEGTGGVNRELQSDKSATVINEIDPATGEVKTIFIPPTKVFGEGLTLFGGKLIQLTYFEKLIFQYPYPEGAIVRMKSPLTEGWGLTNDGKQLIASDGSDKLHFLDPQTMKIKSSTWVRTGLVGQWSLNELEYVGGMVYANVFASSDIVKIDLASGCVLEKFNMSRLLGPDYADVLRLPQWAQAEMVLNGIAHHPAKGTFYVTGKHWDEIFEVRLGP